MIRHRYDLDIVPGRLAPRVHLSQYDERFLVEMRLYAREGRLQLESGTTAKICGIKPNGEAYTAAVILRDNIATIQGDGNLTDVSGTGTFEICLTHGGKELYTTNFDINIEPSPAERSAGN